MCGIESVKETNQGDDRFIVLIALRLRLLDSDPIPCLGAEVTVILSGATSGYLENAHVNHSF
jgi:hypothetical protein